MRSNFIRTLAASCVTCALSLISTGCGGKSSGTPPPPPPPPTSSEFLFATSNATVLTFDVDSNTGALTLGQNGPSVPGNFGIAATPSASFLYTSDSASGGIAGFSINSTGALTALSESPFPLPSGQPGSTFPPVDGVAMHPSGKFLYAPDSAAGAVVGFAIDATTGTLSMIAESPLTAGAQPLVPVIDPTGQFLYVSDFSGPIWGFTIDSSTGVLTPIAGSPFPSEGPDGLVIHPSGKFLYAVLTGENSVQALSINPTTGALTEIAGSPFLLSPTDPIFIQPYSVAQVPNGNFLYVLGAADRKLYELSVDAGSGALTVLAGSPYNVEIALFASSLAVDPSGKFLYYSGEAQLYVNILNIDGATGVLSAASPSSVFAACTPLGLTVVSVPQQ